MTGTQQEHRDRLESLDSSFSKSEHELRRYRAVAGLALGVFLMPLGAIMDWWLYPNAFSQLSFIRFTTTIILAVGWFMMRTGRLEKWFEASSLALIFAPAAAMAWMIYFTEGSQSKYYFGLILLMIVVHLLGFRAKESIYYCLATITVYVVAVGLHAQQFPAPRGRIAEGVFFLITSAMVCVAVTYFSRLHRWTAFKLQSELRDERHQLEQSIRRLRETELRLLQSEKMRAVAGVASGLLHEINNPVNFSLMAVRVLAKKLKPDSFEASTLADIETGVTRIGDIVSDLRSFAHPEQHAQQEPFCLVNAITSAKRFSANEVQLGTIQIANNEVLSTTVMGSRSQITQVFLNLILNAAHAIKNRPNETDEPKIDFSASIKGERLFVTVRDNGTGMDSEQIKRIREPFYTTRTGEGLGLGLSICESIVEAHGGTLVIESKKGLGTKITFDLLVAEPANSAPHVGATVIPEHASGS